MIRLKVTTIAVLLEEIAKFIKMTYGKYIEFQRIFLVIENSNLPHNSWKTYARH